MYRGLSVIAVVPVLNEEGKIGRVLGRIPRAVVDEMLGAVTFDAAQFDQQRSLLRREIGQLFAEIGRAHV